MAKFGQQAVELLPGDTILVSIQAVEKAPSGKADRIPVARTFDGEGFQLNPDMTRNAAAPRLIVKAPAKDGPKLDNVLFQEYAAAGNRQGIATLTKNYLAAVDEYQATGGGDVSLHASIGKAVVEYCKTNLGMKEIDGDWPVIKPSEILVKPTFRIGNDPTTFIVQVAPVWG